MKGVEPWSTTAIVLCRRHASRPEEYLELIQENGLEGLSEIIREMINQAMQFERENFLYTRAYERSEDRTEYANGFAKHAYGEIKDSQHQGR